MNHHHHRTWPPRSGSTPFTTLPHDPNSESYPSTRPRRRVDRRRDFSSLPFDLLLLIGSTFSQRTLNSASLVCRSWSEAMRPLREAMKMLGLGKRYKHGKGVRKDVERALDLFLKGAGRGLSMAMVDAGLVKWEMGERDEAVRLYRRAAEVGDVAGMCNLGIAYLLVKPPVPKEAVKWLYKAASAGHARAQYQFALCLHQGCGTDHHPSEAARWYLRAAEHGYARAMYNVSLCYSLGEGFHKSHRLSKKWMKRAADHGLSKAQFEHGLTLFSEGKIMEAAVYLELAGRAGEASTGALQNIINLQLSAASRDKVRVLANNWRALPSMHRSRAA